LDSATLFPREVTLSAATVRKLAVFPITLALLALAAYGTKRQVCNAASGYCIGSDACVVPQFLYANGVNGQIANFPVEPGGVLGAPTSTPGSAQSLGMVALNNQFLYASNSVILSGGAIDAWTITPGTGALTVVPGSPFSLGLFTLAGGLDANPALQVLCHRVLHRRSDAGARLALRRWKRTSHHYDLWQLRLWSPTRKTAPSPATALLPAAAC
jgi:hypothetical protein